MILLRLLTWPYVRKHKVRTLLTIAGIALGVVVFVAMRTANDAVLFAFQQTVDRIAGKTQLQVSAGESGFPEEVLERVQALPEVRVAVPVIEAIVNVGRKGQGNILVLAVDMTGDRSLRNYDFEEGDEAVIDDPLVFLAQPDSIMLTREFARLNGLAVNSRVPLDTMAGVKQFTVRGLMGSNGLASAFGGNLAVMDVYAAQSVFGRGRTFDRIDLAVNEGASIDDCRRSLEKMLGPGYQVEPPSSRGKQFESIARLFSVGASLNSVFALLIGLFIIYNTFSIAVTQRRSEIGILRALGATRAQIRALFLAESAAVGTIGSVTGIFVGLLMARGMAQFFSAFLGEVYGVAQRTEQVAADPKIIGAALLVGVLTSMLAAWIPARNAALVDPVHALQKGAYQSFSSGENRTRRRVAGALVFLVAITMVWAKGTGPLFYIGYAAIVIAALMLTPTLTRWLTERLRPVLRWLRPVEGALAADSLLQSPRRTSATVAALMLSLALVIGLGGVAKASYGSIVNWLDSSLNPDFLVGSSAQLSDRSFRFSPEIGEQMKQIDGVEDVQMVRTVRVLYRQNPIMVVASDIESLQRRIHPKVIAGDYATMCRLTAEGKGVMAAQNLAIMQNLRLGDMFEIATPGGMLKLPVVGITVDYSDQQGSVLISRAVYKQYWKDDTVNIFRVYLRKGVDQEAAKRRILERFSSQRRLFVLTNQQVRSYVLRVTDQWFAVTYVQIFVAVLVAILGIVNSLTVSISDRRRELGVLQAVGALRSQVRQTIWMEAAGIGAVGLALGFALGAIILYYYLGFIGSSFAGLSLDYEYPVRIAIGMIPIMLLSAWAAAIGPAESAVRGSLVEALEYE